MTEQIKAVISLYKECGNNIELFGEELTEAIENEDGVIQDDIFDWDGEFILESVKTGQLDAELGLQFVCIMFDYAIEGMA